MVSVTIDMLTVMASRQVIAYPTLSPEFGDRRKTIQLRNTSNTTAMSVIP